MSSILMHQATSPYIDVHPDAPIYRIFPLWNFERTLQLRQLTLVRPLLWEDTLETLLERVMVAVHDQIPSRQIPLEPFLRKVYAQCWSATADSDLLLRAYSRVTKDENFIRNTSPREEGVKVRSTPRKLLAVLEEWQSTQATETIDAKSTDHFACVGKVKYMDIVNIQQNIADTIGHHGMEAFSDPRIIVQALLRKRLSLRHENEVRLLHVDARKQATWPYIGIPFDPSSVFEEITFDPRLTIFEKKSHAANARASGYTGIITESYSYQKPVHLIRVDSLPNQPKC